MRMAIFGFFLYMAREWDDLTIEVTHKILDDRWFTLMAVALIICIIMDITDALINIKELLYGSSQGKTNRT